MDGTVAALGGSLRGLVGLVTPRDPRLVWWGPERYYKSSGSLLGTTEALDTGAGWGPQGEIVSCGHRGTGVLGVET